MLLEISVVFTIIVTIFCCSYDVHACSQHTEHSTEKHIRWNCSL